MTIVDSREFPVMTNEARRDDTRICKSIELDGNLLFDRATEGRFPEVKEIKQMVRDQVVPTKSLGHSDVDTEADSAGGQPVDEDGIDDDEAAEARRYFGVM